MTEQPTPDEIRDWRASTAAAADQHLCAMTQPEVIEAAQAFAQATVAYALALRDAGFDQLQAAAAICGAAIQVVGKAVER